MKNVNFIAIENVSELITYLLGGNASRIYILIYLFYRMEKSSEAKPQNGFKK